MAKRGRKDLWYELEMEKRLETITGWAKQGLTNEEMISQLGVSKVVFYKWMKTHPEFKEALYKGKFESNGEILAAAFRQATGYYQPVTEPFKVKTVKNISEDPKKPRYEEVEEVIDHNYLKYFPPNQTMAIFMLKNRLPQYYKDKIEQQIDANFGVQIIDDIGGGPDE